MFYLIMAHLLHNVSLCPCKHRNTETVDCFKHHLTRYISKCVVFCIMVYICINSAIIVTIAVTLMLFYHQFYHVSQGVCFKSALELDFRIIVLYKYLLYCRLYCPQNTVESSIHTVTYKCMRLEITKIKCQITILHHSN